MIRGETAHFDHICDAAATGLSAVGLETGVPVAFGVLTTETCAQAEARAGGAVGNAGADAADAAVVMANLVARDALTLAARRDCEPLVSSAGPGAALRRRCATPRLEGWTADPRR